MNGSRIVGMLLIILGIVLAYYGVVTIGENNHAVTIFGAELDFSNESGKEQGYLYLGLGIVSFVGGLFMFRKKK